MLIDKSALLTARSPVLPSGSNNFSLSRLVEAVGQGSSTFWVRGPIYIFHIILRAVVTAHSTALPLFHLRHRHFTYVTAHSPTLPPLYLHHSSFYNPSVFHRRHRHFTYIIAHSPILLPLHLRHFSFYNPSAASPTSQVILKPFNCFTFVTGTLRTSPSELPMHSEMKKQSVVD